MSFRVTGLTRPFVIECLALFSRWRVTKMEHVTLTTSVNWRCAMLFREGLLEVKSDPLFLLSCLAALPEKMID